MSSEISKLTDGEVLVRVEGVSKKFCRSLKKSLWYGLCDIGGELNPMSRKADKLKLGNSENGSLSASQNVSICPEAVSPSLGSDFSPAAARDENLRDGEFYAVRDVSFELRRGECLGLIGHNGAGKTTLLKMLNGLIKPDAGKITIRGRVGALIALGAGFNPILTGRENIYINGSVLGLSKREVDEKIDEIIDFAEIGEFIDTPVQNYSSGMSVRLGFSIASSLSPDVLILDEVLAVGDVGFVIKCLNRVRELSANAAVIFVSHQMQFVSSFCSRVIFMEHGVAKIDSEDIGQAMERYMAMVTHSRQESGTGTAELHAVNIEGVRASEAVGSMPVLSQGENLTLTTEFTITEIDEPARLTLAVDDETANQIITFPVVDEGGEALSFGPGRHQVQVNVGPIELNAGKYSIMFGITGMTTQMLLTRVQGVCPFQVLSQVSHWSKLVRPVTPVRVTIL